MKLLLPFLIVLPIFFATAQSLALPAPEASFLAIIVSDIDSSIAWYSKHLGFEVQNRMDAHGSGIYQANLLRGNVQLELMEMMTAIFPEEILSEYERGTRIGGFFKVGFRVAEFDRWVEYLRNAEVDFHGKVVVDPISKKKTVIVKDPDGNRIQLFEK